VIYSIDLISNSEKELAPEDLKKLKLTNVWLELREPTKKELRAVSAKTEIPIDFLEIKEAGQSISLRWEQDYGVVNFVVISEIIASKKIYPITMVFSEDFLVTVERTEYQKIVDLAKARMDRVKSDPPSIVAYFLLDEIIDHNFSHIERIEELTADLEEEIMEKADTDTLRKVFRLKSHMVSFNKILWYERGLIFNLRKTQAACITEKARGLFDTAHEFLTRQIDIVETYREIMTDAINVYLSTISNKINSAIKALTIVIFYLTVITTITSFPNTVATFFGISQFGNTDVVIVFAAIVLSIVLPLLWLWKKRWLRPERESMFG
jgi:magnesium transporter